MDEKTRKALETARSLGHLAYSPQAKKEEPLKTKKKRWWQKLRKKKDNEEKVSIRTQDAHTSTVGRGNMTQEDYNRLRGK